jgi:hypothetical protein
MAKKFTPITVKVPGGEPDEELINGTVGRDFSVYIYTPEKTT